MSLYYIMYNGRVKAKYVRTYVGAYGTMGRSECVHMYVQWGRSIYVCTHVQWGGPYTYVCTYVQWGRSIYVCTYICAMGEVHMCTTAGLRTNVFTCTIVEGPVVHTLDANTISQEPSTVTLTNKL